MRPSLLLLLLPATAPAQPVLLAEKPGRASRCELTLTVRGTLKVAAGDKADSFPLVAKASHTFTEWADRPGRTVRRYDAASSSVEVAGERSARELPADRRLIVAQRAAAGVTHYSPAGPLNREELELVAEHLDPQAVAALLPSKAVKVADTWAVPAEAVRIACHLDGVSACAVTGTLTAGGPAATFTLAGTAEGVENGATVKLRVKAEGGFDVAAGQVKKLRWEQADERGQGPASPAAEVTAVSELARTPAESPAAINLPPGDTLPETLTNLRYSDARGRFHLTYPRNWFVVGRSADHVVLRLIDGGAFVAQATVTHWKPAAAGGHTSADEFRAGLAKLPGWEPEAELAAGELAAGPGRWLYRVAARGRQDGQPVVQTFYLLAGPSGAQVAVGVLAQPGQAGAVAGRDERLVRAIELK
jgi:hypothetical protein